MGNRNLEEWYASFKTDEEQIFNDPALQGSYDFHKGLLMLMMLLALLVIELCLIAKEKAEEELETWPKNTKKSIMGLKEQQKEAQLLHQKANYLQQKAKDTENPQGVIELGKHLLGQTVEFQKKYIASDLGLVKTIEALQQQLGPVSKKYTDPSQEEQDTGKQSGSPDLKPRRLRV